MDTLGIRIIIDDNELMMPYSYLVFFSLVSHSVTDWSHKIIIDWCLTVFGNCNMIQVQQNWRFGCRTKTYFPKSSAVQTMFYIHFSAPCAAELQSEK